MLHSVSCDYLNEITSEEYVTLSHQRCICECIYLNMGKNKRRVWTTAATSFELLHFTLFLETVLIFEIATTSYQGFV